MAAQGKSQLPQEMQKAHAGFRPRALALVFKPPPLNPVARVKMMTVTWRCDVDNQRHDNDHNNVHFDCLQEPITLGNQ